MYPYTFTGRPLTGSAIERLERVSARLLVFEQLMKSMGGAADTTGLPSLGERATFFGALAEDLVVLREEAEAARRHACTAINLLSLSSGLKDDLWPPPERQRLLAAARSLKLPIPQQFAEVQA